MGKMATYKGRQRDGMIQYPNAIYEGGRGIKDRLVCMIYNL